MIFDDAAKIALLVFVAKEFYTFFRSDQKLLMGKISDLTDKIHSLDLRIHGLYSRIETMEKLDSLRK